MQLTRPPGPRSALNLGLLMAISDGCDEIRYRRVRVGFEMWWLVNGVRYDGDAHPSAYVRSFVGLLGRLSGEHPGLIQRARRFVRRLGAATECGAFDFPVGPVFVVEVSYRAAWRRGRVSELDIVLGESTAVVASGIAKLECELAWHGPLHE